ncbi:upstream activation factor subunit spp27 [Scaptodrosophila lebanonensis]|uniref:Upstream activation factor subunit spp27 n=1 Tax=Drosophila lebanonensis TaxID=7225 RepID=A0A6J2TBC7_DROLE|nr:upstream activation factor subunit spp27 [Scaptodrosophila lebanonensis]
MSDVSTDDLRREIQAVLKDADLATISAKRVREQVESKLNCSLLSRKKQFDAIVMEVINEQQQDDDEDDDKDPDAEEDSEPSEEEDDVSSEEEQKKKKPAQKKRPQPTKHKVAAKKKRKSINADDSGTESDAGSDSDYEVPKKTSPKKKAKSGSGGGSGTGRKGTGFTRAYNLSPELSALMGADSLPRHEVVKKVWAIIKERDLYDPKNKQFAICDDELMKVMRVKRFRTFGMLKHLKPHFLD